MIRWSDVSALRPVFNGRGKRERDLAAAVLRRRFATRVVQDGEVVYLRRGTDREATVAGDVLMDHGFTGGICW